MNTPRDLSRFTHIEYLLWFLFLCKFTTKYSISWRGGVCFFELCLSRDYCFVWMGREVFIWLSFLVLFIGVFNWLITFPCKKRVHTNRIISVLFDEYWLKTWSDQAIDSTKRSLAKACRRSAFIKRDKRLYSARSVLNEYLQVTFY